MFYVLHHSSTYWVNRTLSALSTALHSAGTLAIIEDSLIYQDTPQADPEGLFNQWKVWTENTNVYDLSVGYDVQVILDFVAVQLLANFSDVEMPCNYQTGNGWTSQFLQLGFDVSQAVNIGFPKNRDIDVPQALFMLKRHS
jgi:hypothetical protein